MIDKVVELLANCETLGEVLVDRTHPHMVGLKRAYSEVFIVDHGDGAKGRLRIYNAHRHLAQYVAETPETALARALTELLSIDEWLDMARLAKSRGTALEQKG